MEQIANKETYRSYIYFWTGQLFSLLGSMVVFFVITWWIADVYVSEVLLAIASFLYILMMTLCMPIAGVLADRINRKQLIVIVDSLQAFSTFLLIMLFQFGIANIWIVLVFISIRSVFQAFHVPTVNAIIPTMVPKNKLTRINGINFLFTGVVQLFAPFIGALLLIFVSVYMILWVDVITFFIALIPLLLISIPSVNHVNHVEEEAEKSSFIKEFKLGIKTLKFIPGLITMLILTMILNFMVRPLDTLMPLFIKVTHRGGASLLALAEMVFTGGMIAGAIVTSVKKSWKRKIRAIFISLVGAMIGYMILALAPSGSYLILAIGGVVLGFNLPIINSIYQTFLQTTVPPDKLGRVTSIDHTFSMAISPIGSLISGPLAVIIGIPSLFFFCALISLISTVAFWSFTGIRKIDIDSKTELEKINGQIESIVI
ncbi:MAG: MFS transporter [Candidatus Heimdallarchaeota archaeon]